jgi:peptidoglycan/xylan/chitin deacetylase (PgdA/CDA1 family)
MVVSRSHLKRVYFTLMALLRRDARLLKKIRRDDLLLILNFHRISPERNPFWNPLHPAIFEDLLVFVKRHFDVVRFGDIDSADRTRPLAVISFDDGYHDFVEYAMPLLHKHRLAANQNIIPACVDSGCPPWNVQLVDFLNSAPRTLINELQLPGFPNRLAGDDADGKTRYGVALSRFLKSRPARERAALWPAVTGLMERTAWGMTRMMSLEDVRQAAGSHEIGAHSYSHESMAHESNEFFETDLNRCFDYFDRNLRLPLHVYAFPNGSYRPEHLAILQKSGIRHVLLVDEKFASRRSNVCPRFTIYGDSYQEAKFRALGYYSQGEAMERAS